ncbi:TolAQR complex membrane spanning protein [Wigglesworthia glossinidia endosymbiont of Glossina morsitans morsitans (Yale colony)]|uniref:TolAQR complex membrane spanning protein n=1 Tax=Wigglesworthia glossinidia endosymbiont of Glossina morsitans morsitans (Yale colony) TaxID=1142511 RepID=H6Q5Y7_WIGGL|nr:biopolymer transporter ExbD [Wigglesworthia glossinidia]AFA41183.1 TolAQR complex membrane spanning protein [Wigglesworthia glossinidia endosymbiont of Glossina morsitans morsitans (Yale colony)]
MRRKLYKNVKFDINIIPLVDVLLVLMLIFMIFSQDFLQKITVNLPKENFYDTQNEQIEIIIEILNKKKYNLLTQKNKEYNLNLQQLSIAIKNKFLNNPRIKIFIGGEKSIPYEEIIKIISVLNKIGVQSIGLIAQSDLIH